jgi:monofunctional glycosyltransferase
VVEWGDGVYGIEGGAREHFGISVINASVAQGAILAAMLPAPRRRSPKAGSKALKKRAHWIIDQMQAAKRISPEQATAGQAEIDRILGGGKPDAEDSTDEDGS